MTDCGHLISGDPARPCVLSAGHRGKNHRDVAYNERHRERAREYREQNRNHVRQLDREYRERNRDCILERRRKRNRKPAARRAEHASYIRRKYGLEPHEYAEIKKAQGGRCAICAIATGRSKRLSVDHCHKTREIRGLLCTRCNAFLGMIRDNPEAGDRLARYLRNPPAPQALGKVVLVPADSPAQQPRKRRPRAAPKTR